MNEIQQYELAYGGMVHVSTGHFTLKEEARDIVWCKYSDAEPLEETNRSLCRDLDEAQKVVEKKDQRIAELVVENETLKQFDFSDNDLWNDSVRSRWEMILTQATVRIERYSERTTKLEKFIDDLAADSDLSPMSDWREGM